MKIRIFSFVLFLTVSFSLNAENLVVKIKKHTAQSITVQLANLEKVRTKISLQDLNGKMWFSEFVRGQNGYFKKLDLEGMPTGTYLLTITNKKDYQVQAMAKLKDNLIFFENDQTQKCTLTHLASNTPERAALITRITVKEKFDLRVHLANLHQASTKLKLKAISGQTIWSEKVKDRAGIAKCLSMQSQTRGRYYLIIQHKNLMQFQFFQLTNTGIVLDQRQQIQDNQMSSNFAVLN